MSKKIRWLILWGYVAFILYGSWIPFDIDFSSVHSGLMLAFRGRAPGTHQSLTDIVSNILLFGLLGVLLWLLLSNVMRRWVLILFGVGLGFLLSLFIEFTQVFISARVSAWHDVVVGSLSNMTGIAVGFFLKLIYEKITNDLSRQSTSRSDPWIPILLFGSLLIAQAFFPFHFSLDVSDVWSHIKTAQLQPFHSENIHQAFFWADFFRDAASFYILAYFITHHLRSRRTGSMGITISSILLGLSFLLILQMGKLAIPERTVSVDNLIAGGIGVLLAEVIAAKGSRGIWVYLLWVGCIFLAPYQFTLTSRGMSLIPFRVYFSSTYWIALLDFLEVFMLGMGLGLLKAQEFPDSFQLPTKALLIKNAIWGSCIILPLEMAQIFLPARTADITDVIIFASGCSFGTVLMTRPKRDKKIQAIAVL